jgi:hypothetical protein
MVVVCSLRFLRSLPSQNSYEVTQRHVHPLLRRIADTMPLRDDNSGDCVIVATFDLGLALPSSKADLRGVFALGDDTSVADGADSAEVASIARPRTRSSLDSVVKILR